PRRPRRGQPGQDPGDDLRHEDARAARPGRDAGRARHASLDRQSPGRVLPEPAQGLRRADMGLFDFLKKKEAPKIAPRPTLRPGLAGAGMLAPRPEPKAKNNFVIVILDSCRFDSFVAADPKTIQKLGKLERRFSYASWTAPSHYNLLTGLLPHTTPPNVYASDYYKEDFFNYNRRLGAKGIEFGKMVPGLWLPRFLPNTPRSAT